MLIWLVGIGKGGLGLEMYIGDSGVNILVWIMGGCLVLIEL